MSPEAQALLFTDARTVNAFIAEPVTDEYLTAIFSLSNGRRRWRTRTRCAHLLGR